MIMCNQITIEDHCSAHPFRVAVCGGVISVTDCVDTTSGAFDHEMCVIRTQGLKATDLIL